jgi:hypothetical protein
MLLSSARTIRKRKTWTKKPHKNDLLIEAIEEKKRKNANRSEV